jgi:O-antigen ligase
MHGVTARRPGIAALPFIGAIFVQGLPLSLGLAPPEQRWAEEMHQLTLSRVTTFGFESAWPPTVVWATFYLIAAWAVLRGPRPVLPRGVLLNVGGMVVFAFATSLWSHYPQKVLTTGIHALGGVFVALAAAHRYRADPWSAVRHMAYALGANITIQLVGVLAMGRVTIDWTGRWAGFAPHPNVFGLIAFATAWANGAALVSPERKRAAPHLAFLALAVVALIGTQSVTSLVAAVAAVGGTFGLSFRERLRFSGKRVLGIGSIAALLGAFLLGGTVYSWGELANALGRSSDMSGRLWIWSVALDLTAECPWFGWGFDDNATVIELTALPYSHFHNGFVDLAVRGGAAAVALVGVFLARAFRDLLRKGSRSAQVLCFLPLLVAIALHNTTEVSLFVPRNLLWLLVLFLSFLGALPPFHAASHEPAPEPLIAPLSRLPVPRA